MATKRNGFVGQCERVEPYQKRDKMEESGRTKIKHHLKHQVDGQTLAPSPQFLPVQLTLMTDVPKR